MFLAVALTSVPAFTWSFGITMFPFPSIVKPASSGLNVHALPFFVAVTVFLLPCGSVYSIVIDPRSASAGGVTLTVPSSFAFTVGAAGAPGV